MNIDKLTDLVEDEVLKRLPEEALDQILELEEDDKDYDIAINAIFKRYGIDPVEIANSLTKKGENR